MDITQNDGGMNVNVVNSLTLVHQNIRGLSNKLTEFVNTLSLENINPQFLCFSEHHMLESNLCLTNIQDCNLGASFCCQMYQKGGVCIYVRRDIDYKSLNVTRYCEEKCMEVRAIQIESKINQQIIICVYRAPSGYFPQFLRLLETLLMSLYRPTTEFIICGDVNRDFLSDSHMRQQLTQLLGTYNMLQTVNFPTRIQNNCRSAIDNIFINKSQLHLHNVLPLYNGLSDHDAQYLVLKNFFGKEKTALGKCKVRVFTSDLLKCFQELLSKETWEVIYQEQDINKIFNTFLNIFLTIFETSFPKIYHVKQKDNAWLTKGIRVSCHRKRSLYFLSRNSDDVKLKTYYKRYCSILRKTIREAKKLITMS